MGNISEQKSDEGKKNICIVTICNGSNFGNRLQNYALQETLKKVFNANVVTARNIGGDIGKRFLKSNVFFYLLQSKFVELLVLKFIKNSRVRKKIKFLRFNKKYICWSKQTVDKDKIPNGFQNQYDYFVAGSDQIWNPDFSMNSSFECLCFAENEKKIAYAASFGVDELSEKQQKLYKQRLSGFEKISVREEAGVNILKQLGKENVSVVLDPTLLLTSGEWEELEKKPEFEVIQGAYLLSYILDTENSRAKEQVRRTADEKGLRIIDIYNHENYMHYGISPAEFIWLIHHADCIYTDSFHATVFSILFHKRFAVFTRGNMNSRINTLLKMLSGKSDIIWNNGSYMSNMYYEETEKILNIKRNNSLDYLKSALNK